MATGKNSVVVYKDWISTFDKLSDAEAGRLIKHFFRYVNDLNPDPPDRITELVFEPIKCTLKRDLVRYEDIRQKRSEAGKSGGRPKVEESKQTEAKKANAFFGKQTEAKKADSVSVSVSVSASIDSDESNLLLEKEAKEREIDNTLPVGTLPSSAREKNQKSKIKNYESIFWGEVREHSPYGDGRLHKLCGEWDKANPGKYPADFFKDFLTYWTATVEQGSDRGKELWRTQKTWSLAGRLNTSWNIFKKNYTEGKTNMNDEYSKKTLSGLAGIFARERARRAAEREAARGNDTGDDSATSAVVAE